MKERILNSSITTSTNYLTWATLDQTYYLRPINWCTILDNYLTWTILAKTHLHLNKLVLDETHHLRPITWWTILDKCLVDCT